MHGWFFARCFNDVCIAFLRRKLNVEEPESSEDATQNYGKEAKLLLELIRVNYSVLLYDA